MVATLLSVPIPPDCCSRGPRSPVEVSTAPDPQQCDCMDGTDGHRMN